MQGKKAYVSMGRRAREGGGEQDIAEAPAENYAPEKISIERSV
jgi:hypothetical protein